MNGNVSLPQGSAKLPRNGRKTDQAKRSSVLTEAEFRTYYKAVLGEDHVPDSQTVDSGAR